MGAADCGRRFFLLDRVSRLWGTRVRTYTYTYTHHTRTRTRRRTSSKQKMKRAAETCQQGKPRKVVPTSVAFSQATINTQFHTGDSVEAWEDRAPYSVPIRTLRVDSCVRRLYAARNMSLPSINTQEIDACAVVDKARPFVFAWEEHAGQLYLLELRPITWAALVTVRCAQQTPEFPLTGSIDMPRLKSQRDYTHRAEIGDDPRVQQDICNGWDRLSRASVPVYLSIQDGKYHYHQQFLAYVTRHRDLFRIIDFSSRTGAMKARADTIDDEFIDSDDEYVFQDVDSEDEDYPTFVAMV